MTTVRIFSVVCIFIVLLFLSPWPAGAAPIARGYVGLYADANHSINSIQPPAWTPFTMWVWWLPGDTGMKAAEFAIQYPSNVIAATVVANPAIIVSLGSLPSGISVTFDECQTGWTWTHSQLCYPMSTAPGILWPVAHPVAGAYQIATCELGFPIEPVMLLSPLCLNDPACYHPEHIPASLVGVTIQAASAIRAIFNECVQANMPPRYFVLHNKADATDSTNVLQATRMDDNEYDLILEEAMADGTTYILRNQLTLWGCDDYMFTRPSFEFTFHEATATEESSWGAIKALFGN